MAENIKDGGPAFPVHPNTNPAGEAAGMSLRDWFAGQALVGLLASDEMPRLKPGEDPQSFLAEVSFHYADAMILVGSR